MGSAEAYILFRAQLAKLAAAQFDLRRRWRLARRQHEVVAAVVFLFLQIYVGLGHFVRRALGRSLAGRPLGPCALLLGGPAQLLVQIDFLCQNRGVAAAIIAL